MKKYSHLLVLLFCIVCMNYAKAQSRKYLHETTISLRDLFSFENNHGLRVDSSEPWDKVTVTANVSQKNNVVLNTCDTGDLIVLYKAYVDTNSTTLEHNADEGYLYLNHFDNDQQCKVLSTSTDSSSYLKKNTLFVGRKLMQQNNEIDGFKSLSQVLHLTIHLELEGDLSVSDIHEIVLPGNRSLRGTDFTEVPDIEVYRENSTVPELTYNIKEQQSNPLNLQMGDSVVFNSFDKNLLIEGMADIWVAHSAGEVKFYADASIKMGGFKPFLGYDAQVHGVKLRKYPMELDGKLRYPRMKKRLHDYYTTYWIAQRQQNFAADPYDPYTSSNGNVRFSKVKTASDFGRPSFKVGDELNIDVQRNNQREGYNVELFNEFYPVIDMTQNNGVTFDAAKEYTGKKLVSGLDSDEIFYVNHPFAAASSLNDDQYLLKQDVETWKILMENEHEDAIAMMVSLYQANRMHKVVDYERELYFEKYPSVFYYKGKEILDKNQFTYDSNVQETKAYFNYKRPIIHNQTFEGIPEKGAFLWSTKGSSVNIPINVTVPGTNDDSSSTKPFKGFYGSISGDSYPSVQEKMVTYSIPPYYLEAPGLYTLRYTYENELGLIKIIEKEFDENAQVTFDIGFEQYAKGYHDIQLCYRRTLRTNSSGSYNDTGVIVAGKELHSIALRFASAPGDQGSEFSEDPTIFTKNGLLDLKEGRGSGNAWYLGDIIKSEPYFTSSGDRDYSVNRTYTFKQGEQIVFTAMDADPHMFIHYEPEWYVSERAMSKRLTDIDLESRISWYLNTTRHQNDPGYSSKPIGTGRHLSYEFIEEPGVYYLSAVYNDVSEINHKIVIQPTTLNDMGTVGFYPLQQYHRNWLLEFFEDSDINVPILDNLQIAKVENIHSAYTYVDGVRAPFNNTQSKSNRFASQNDYYATYEVDCSLETCIDADSFTISNENLADWFPNNWVRHFSDSPLPLDINASLVMPFDSFDENNLPGTNYEAWQWRFPWISYTSTEGYRTRWNIKTLYDMNNLFDNDRGALSGKAFGLLKRENYHIYDNTVYGPSRDGTGIISDCTEQERLKYHFYLDLKYKRKVILNVGLLFEDLKVDFFQKDQDNNRGQRVASGVFKYPTTGFENKGTVKKNSSDKEQDFLVQLAPNPTKNGQFKVSLGNHNSCFVSIEVVNVLGQTKFNLQRYLEAGDQFVTLPQNQILSPGVYHVKVTMGTKTITRKVIVKN
jgi:hypothetical protein